MPEARARRLALAWMVGDPFVLPHRARGPAARVADCLTTFPPHLGRREALEASREVQRDVATPYDGLVQLARGAVSLQMGRPVLEHRNTWGGVAAVLDIDALIVARMLDATASRPLGQDRLGWPPIPRVASGENEAILHGRRVEPHLHLGGAVPAGLAWLEALSEELSVRRLLQLETREQVERWSRWIKRAREALGGLVPVDNSADARPTAGGSDGLVARLVSERDAFARLLDSEAARVTGWDERQPWRVYLAVKSAFLRGLVLGPGQGGLWRFRRRLQRHRAASLGPGPGRMVDRVAEANRMSTAIEAGLLDLDPTPPAVRGGRWVVTTPLDLELRLPLPPARDRWRLRAMLIGLRRALARFDAPIRIGLIHQLSKTRASGAELPRQVDALVSFLVDYPDMRALVVGVDAAGDEIGTPPRTFVRAFRRLSESIATVSPAGPAIRLRRTFHVGEDFRDLLSGVRHVHEAATPLGLEARDRLGHALALFWDPERYYVSPRGTGTRPSLGAHLLDLAWAVSALRQSGGHAEAAIAWELLVAALRSAGEDSGHGDRHDARPAQADLLVAAMEEQTAWTDHELLQLVTGVGHFDRRWELELSAPWFALVEAARRQAWRAVSRARLFVEVNPTSKLMVVGLSDYTELPYLRRLVETGGACQDEVPLVVGTDDPGIFQTTLSHEHLAVFGALVELGMPWGRATSVVERMHEASQACMFIASDAPRGAELDALLARVLGVPTAPLSPNLART